MGSSQKPRVKTKKVASKHETKSKKPEPSATKAKASKNLAKVNTIVVPSEEDSTDDDSAPDSDAPHVTKDNDSISSSNDDSSSKEEEGSKVAKLESSSSSGSSSSSSDSSESSEDEELVTRPEPPPKKMLLKRQQAPSPDESSDSSEDEDESPSKTPSIPAKKAKSSSSDSDDAGDSDEESSETSTEDRKAAVKRKALESASQPPKRMKLVNGKATPTTIPAHKDEIKSIFVGRLSWNVDDDWLAQEFAACGEVVSASVQIDRNTGKSRGFGYVHFATAEAVTAALAMNGKEIDGRPVNIDKSQSPDPTRSRNNRAKAFGDDTGPPSNTLFVANLSFFAKEDALWELFGEYGSVKSVRLPTDRETGRPKGIAYVEFESIESAKKAFEGARNCEVEGRAIRLDFAQPRDNSGTSARGGLSDRGGRGNSRGGFRGFGDRGAGHRGRGGARGGRGGHRGRIAPFEGKKTTFS